MTCKVAVEDSEVDEVNRVCMGHGKPGKSLNFTISFSRPGN